MAILTALFLKILPFYFLIFIGFLLGISMKIDLRSISTVVIYAITPMVVFKGVVDKHFSYDLLYIPLVVYAIFTTLSLLSLLASRIAPALTHTHDKRVRAIVSFTAAAGNTGYIGLPLTLAIFGEEAISIAVLAIFGNVLFEYTIGIYFLSRGNFTRTQSLLKLLKLPALYALLVGIVVKYLMNHHGLQFPGSVYDLLTHFQGAYSTLGMLFVGLTLATTKLKNIHVFALIYPIFSRFLLSPLLTTALIFLDKNLFHLFSASPQTALIYNVVLLLSCTPVAANSVMFANLVGLPADDAAIAVIISTFLSLLYLPLAISLMI
ncbi:MAG: AEC family transporter [Oligoflexia bacterium]|nr:AEC family transporter [Oligoflexia bacterium]